MCLLFTYTYILFACSRLSDGHVLGGADVAVCIFIISEPLSSIRGDRKDPWIQWSDELTSLRDDVYNQRTRSQRFYARSEHSCPLIPATRGVHLPSAHGYGSPERECTHVISIQAFRIRQFQLQRAHTPRVGRYLLHPLFLGKALSCHHFLDNMPARAVSPPRLLASSMTTCLIGFCPYRARKWVESTINVRLFRTPISFAIRTVYAIN